MFQYLKPCFRRIEQWRFDLSANGLRRNLPGVNAPAREWPIYLPIGVRQRGTKGNFFLTVIGQFAQAIVASKVSGNRFTIKTDRPGVEVSWQATGVRKDVYANKHRIPVEQEKPERERGYYIHPKLFDQPEEKALEWALNPETMRQVQSQRREADLRRREKENDR
jgi:hypothetical protein